MSVHERERERMSLVAWCVSHHLYKCLCIGVRALELSWQPSQSGCEGLCADSWSGFCHQTE